MGGKFYISVGLLVFLLLISLFIGFWVENRQDAIKEVILQAVSAAQAQDMQESLRLLRQAEARWNNWRNWAASCSHHAAIEEIDSLFAQLHHCDRQGFILGGTRLCSLLDTLTDDHKLTLWNFL